MNKFWFILALVCWACEKPSACYSPVLEYQYRDMACPDHGELVCGCDGNSYVNRCSAHQYGIFVLHEGPCNGDEEWNE